MGPTSKLRVRKVRPADAGSWLEIRNAFWPESGRAEHRREIRAFFSGTGREPQAVLVAEDGKARVIGIAELSIRAYAEGCRSDRVAYLEGWYVVPDARGRGVGRALVEAAEAWGRAKGCTEFASDTLSTNRASIAAHRALGFEDAGLVRCFRKDL